MKDIDIHNGLQHQELRDFLSQSMVDCEVKESKNKKTIIPHIAGEPFRWAKLDALAQIDYLQNYIRILDHKTAIWTLIDNQGWQEWDVSDYVRASYSPHRWMCFVGTVKEHEAFLKQFEDE